MPTARFVIAFIRYAQNHKTRNTLQAHSYTDKSTTGDNQQNYLVHRVYTKRRLVRKSNYHNDCLKLNRQIILFHAFNK